MSEIEIKVKDVVQHVFTNTKYIVLEVREEKTFGEKVGEVLEGKAKGDLFCESENGQRGWLHHNLVKKIKN